MNLYNYLFKFYYGVIFYLLILRVVFTFKTNQKKNQLLRYQAYVLIDLPQADVFYILHHIFLFTYPSFPIIKDQDKQLFLALIIISAANIFYSFEHISFFLQLFSLFSFYLMLQRSPCRSCFFDIKYL